MQLGLSLKTQPLNQRAERIFDSMVERIHVRTDFFFSGLLVAEWAFGIFCSLMISPYTWEGSKSQLHVHVWAALFLGLAIISMPVALGVLRPGRSSTRHAIAVGQMLMSGLLIHLTGGRIETHFHVFGSLAFLAFYRDWRVLLTATAIVTADHFLRGEFWPQSVFGTVAVSNWRWLEHAGWVLFEDIFLIYGCLWSTNEMRAMSAHQEKLHSLNEEIERTVQERTNELKEAQDKLVHAQKMEALGQLSAGIAHDFNNILASILAYASMLRVENSENPDLAVPLENIEKASERGAAMVKKLLAFGRKGNYEKAPIDLRMAVRETIGLIGPSLEGRIKVVNKTAPEEIWPIEGDSSQICQSLMNLAINARDAMPDGGVLTFEVRNVVQADHAGGDYSRFVEVEVSDTGHGIPAAIQEKIFEPFFTTKRVGKGTGLGLPMVYGTVKSHLGNVVVRSTVGSGSSFTLIFPAMPPERVASSVVETAEAAPGGKKIAAPLRSSLDLKGMRLLVADDDTLLRDCIRDLLETRGAKVFVATNGVEAVKLFREHGASLDAVVLDVTMPEMDGIQAFQEIHKIDPNARVLLASGYTESARISALRKEYRVSFLEKPFPVDHLVQHLLRKAS